MILPTGGVRPRLGRLDRNAVLLLSVRLERSAAEGIGTSRKTHANKRIQKKEKKERKRENLHISICHIPHYVLFEIISIQYINTVILTGRRNRPQSHPRVPLHMMRHPVHTLCFWNRPTEYKIKSHPTL